MKVLYLMRYENLWIKRFFSTSQYSSKIRFILLKVTAEMKTEAP